MSLNENQLQVLQSLPSYRLSGKKETICKALVKDDWTAKDIESFLELEHTNNTLFNRGLAGQVSTIFAAPEKWDSKSLSEYARWVMGAWGALGYELSNYTDSYDRAVNSLSSCKKYPRFAEKFGQARKALPEVLCQFLVVPVIESRLMGLQELQKSKGHALEMDESEKCLRLAVKYSKNLPSTVKYSLMTRAAFTGSVAGLNILLDAKFPMYAESPMVEPPLRALTRGYLHWGDPMQMNLSQLFKKMIENGANILEVSPKRPDFLVSSYSDKKNPELGLHTLMGFFTNQSNAKADAGIWLALWYQELLVQKKLNREHITALKQRVPAAEWRPALLAVVESFELQKVVQKGTPVASPVETSGRLPLLSEGSTMEDENLDSLVLPKKVPRI